MPADDPRLRFAPPDASMAALEVLAWWRQAAPGALGLSTRDGLDLAAIDSLAFVTTGHGSPWSRSEALGIAGWNSPRATSERPGCNALHELADSPVRPRRGVGRQGC